MKKILIVDDDRMLAELLGNLLETFGYPAPVYSGDGLEGLYALEYYPEVILVFTDREMPNMDGPTFIQKCRRTYKDREIKIVYTSGSLDTDDDLIAAAREVGADAALPKPFLPHKVLDALTIADVNPKMFQ